MQYVRQIKCAAPLFAAVVDIKNFEVFTVVEGEAVTIATVVDDMGYQLEAGVVMTFEWHGSTDRLCDAAIRAILALDV